MASLDAADEATTCSGRLRRALTGGGCGGLATFRPNTLRDREMRGELDTGFPASRFAACSNNRFERLPT
nr:hypothetical protein [Nitrosomonas nitrosa]